MEINEAATSRENANIGILFNYNFNHCFVFTQKTSHWSRYLFSHLHKLLRVVRVLGWVVLGTGKDPILGERGLVLTMSL